MGMVECMTREATGYYASITTQRALCLVAACPSWARATSRPLQGALGGPIPSKRSVGEVRWRAAGYPRPTDIRDRKTRGCNKTDSNSHHTNQYIPRDLNIMSSLLSSHNIDLCRHLLTKWRRDTHLSRTIDAAATTEAFPRRATASWTGREASREGHPGSEPTSMLRRVLQQESKLPSRLRDGFGPRMPPFQPPKFC
jgi:hypothetical protein